MKLNTKHFGEIEVDESGIIEFPEGLPGFEKLKKFVVLDKADGGMPFHWLQSIDDTSIAFVIIDPFYIKNDYEIDIDDEEISVLGVSDLKDVLVYTIVVVPKIIANMTANLRAPVLINVANKVGKQVVLHNTDYDVSFKIFDGLRQDRR